MSQIICERYVQWAREAVEEWDGQLTAELFALIMARTGEKPREALFAVGRVPTENERHLLNLLSWRDHEARQRTEEFAILREQLEVAVDRSQSWKNLCEHYKELAEARGEALDRLRGEKKVEES